SLGEERRGGARRSGVRTLALPGGMATASMLLTIHPASEYSPSRLSRRCGAQHDNELKAHPPRCQRKVSTEFALTFRECSSRSMSAAHGESLQASPSTWLGRSSTALPAK